jgi:hypothetical protein
MENDMTGMSEQEARLRREYDRLNEMNEAARRQMQSAYEWARERGLVYETPKIRKTRGRRPRRKEAMVVEDNG